MRTLPSSTRYRVRQQRCWPNMLINLARVGRRIALVRMCVLGSYNDRILSDDLRNWHGFNGDMPQPDGSLAGGGACAFR